MTADKNKVQRKAEKSSAKTTVDVKTRTLLEPNDIDAEDQQTSLRKLLQTKPTTQ
jgi:hypothetical protein